MTVLTCKKCGAKVESNRCCGAPMKLQGTMLICESCEKEVNVNNCCKQPMVAKA